MPKLTPADVIEWPAGDAAARTLGVAGRRHGGLMAPVLAVLSGLYGAGVGLRNLSFDLGVRRAYRVGVPVFSVGNLVAGGAGKTPFTRWLVRELIRRNRRVAIVHGGYGSDEPALHRQWQPGAIVLAERDRLRAARSAIAMGADAIVLDDAFQHRRLARDLDVVLLPAESTSRRLLPRGPMREPLRSLERADVLVVTRKTAAPERALELADRARAAWGKPAAVAALLPAGTASLAPGPAGRAAVVAAIARPDLLLEQLRAGGIDVARLLAYPDHFDYSEADRDHIRRRADGLPIITTEKDAVKLRPLFEPGELRVLEQEIIIESGGAELAAMIEQTL